MKNNPRILVYYIALAIVLSLCSLTFSGCNSGQQDNIVFDPGNSTEKNPSDKDSSSSNRPFSYKELKMERIELAPMSKVGNYYIIQAQVQDETGGFKVVTFKVQRPIVDSLGFSESEVRNACEAAAGRARNYIETFIYNGTPELRSKDNVAIAFIPIIVGANNPAKMFITGKVTKAGEALPMRVSRYD